MKFCGSKTEHVSSSQAWEGIPRLPGVATLSLVLWFVKIAVFTNADTISKESSCMLLVTPCPFQWVR